MGWQCGLSHSYLDFVADKRHNSEMTRSRPVSSCASILMSVLLLIQAVSGWCWQPAHSGACVDGSLMSVRSAASCCDHCRHSDTDIPRQGPGKCRMECSSVCTFLQPERTHVDSRSVTVPVGYAVVLTAIASEFVHAFLIGLTSESAQMVPPLRLHLLHQLLLI